MQDPSEQRPGASGRRWEARLRASRQRRRGHSSQPSQFERAIAKGVAGEEIVGRELTALAEEMHLAVLHDLALPGETANIDHLVIGPAGVTVIDAKAWEGRLWIGHKTMRIGKFSKFGALEGVREQVARVNAVLSAAGHTSLQVRGLLCMVNANGGVPQAGLKWVGDVGVGTIPTVRGYVTRPGMCDLAQIRNVYDTLASHLVVSGGGYQPSIAAPQAAPQPDLVDKLILEINRDNDRLVRKRRRRRWMLVAASVVGLVAAGSAFVPEEPNAPMTRAQLDEMRPQLRALASERAGRRVARAVVRQTPEAFVLRYRVGSRCRVRVSVDRATAARDVASSNCGRRH